MANRYGTSLALCPITTVQRVPPHGEVCGISVVPPLNYNQDPTTQNR